MNEMRPFRADPPQRRASDPSASAWVSANAGSGKTQVLVQRVMRLLLDGTLPERILCITFTNAAAAEMSRRLFRELGEWITLDDVGLVEKLKSISGRLPGRASLARARRLFACALDAPGGLKIQTIHAFCERMLQRFPVEAGVVPGFSVLSEQSAGELLAAAARLALTGNLGAAETESIRTVVRYAGAAQFDALINELLKQPHLVAQLADPVHRRNLLERALGLSPGTTPGSVAQAACAEIDNRAYERAAAALDALGGRASSSAKALRTATAESALERRLELLRELCLTKDGDSRHRFPPARLARTDPSSDLFLRSELARLLPFFETYRAAVVAEATDCLLHLSSAIMANYERAKRALGSYDYDDLILRALGLFSNPAHRGWILYKLDGGIDHILIDEAQDTSPEQWQIVQNLSEDFFSGLGARGELPRTVFAVGDEKQSIFSFQGADPRYFRAMRDYFAARISGAGAKFDQVPLTVSFRSASAVLEAVDAVFPEEAHEAARRGAAGCVEIWPIERGEDEPPRDPWQAPTERAPPGRPRRMLARRIARRIRRWLDDKEVLPSRGRPIEPSDILILVRNRTTLMDEIVRALKLEGLPVAGADRLQLTTHIAVMDLIALAHFACLPEDDHMLACLLKSPFLERDDGQLIDDEDLFTLAHGRGNSTLWQRLLEAVDSGAPYRQACERLMAWCRDAGRMPAYEFFSAILNEQQGMRRILARLGSEAVEPVSEFLSRCLDYDDENAPSLSGFLSWIGAQGAMVKRDMDFGSGEIRVMTVHGAKGLEANMVILPDTCAVPDMGQHPKIFFHAIELDGRTIEVPLWRVKLDCDPDPLAALRDEYQLRQFEEHDRLLYVAMTRAADRLYVCGAASRDLPERCWYRRIEDALQSRGLGRPCDDGEGFSVWRHERSQQSHPEADAARRRSPQFCEPLPPWASLPVISEPRTMPWIAPSRAAEYARGTESERISSPLAGSGRFSYRRGVLIHRLLQALPSLPLDRREARARAFLALKGHGLSSEEQDEIALTVLRVLDHHAFADVFAPEGLAETPIAARIALADGTRVPVLGRIDRLLLRPREALILDFKSNRPPPETLQAVDASHVRQLALYRLAVLQMFPGRAVRAALLWTEGPKLMEFPPNILEQCLA